MNESRNLPKASASAAIIAGPVFLILLTLLSFQEQAGSVTQVSVAAIPGAFLILMLSVLFGAILAFPICLLVGGALTILSSALPLFRSVAFWLLAAGGIGFGIIAAFGFDLEAGAIAFIVTAITCAAIVHTRLHWD